MCQRWENSFNNLTDYLYYFTLFNREQLVVMNCLLWFYTVFFPESTEEALWAAQISSEKTHHPCRFPAQNCHNIWTNISHVIGISLISGCSSLFDQAHSEISLEKNERQWLERDLEEASRRLAMAHQDIRRLTNELDAAKNNNLEPSGVLPRFIDEITANESITIFNSFTT